MAAKSEEPKNEQTNNGQENNGEGNKGSGDKPKGSQSVLRVYQYDATTEAIKQKRIIQLGDSTSLNSEKLSFIRALLAREKVFDSPEVGSPFCDSKGSEVSDETEAPVYFGVLESENDSEKKPKSSAVSAQLDVYYKKKKKWRTNMDDDTKEFLKKQLDLSLKNPDLPTANVKLLESTFDPKRWAASKKGDLTHAADLSERDWSIITRTNCILSGHKLVTYKTRDAEGQLVDERRVERSPYNAFNLKKREFEGYEISASAASAGISSGTATASETSSFSFRIPRFRVDDDSYVTVYETKNAREESMLKSSFSDISVQASAGAGFWGVSAAASGGFSKKETNESIDASSTKDETMNIRYNFPRVTVYLDPASLEITEECKKDIAKVKDKRSLVEFSEKYGDVFAQRVRLGGTLYSSQSSKASGSQTKQDKAEAMKIAAAASFSSSWVQASASFNKENGSAQSQNESNQNLNNSLAWEATGGDTLLCNNPPEWCATVGDFYNWRVVDQNAVLPLYQVLSKFPGFDEVKHQFEASAEDRYMPGRSIQYQFKVIDDKTGEPLMFCQDDKTLYNQLSSEFGQAKSGISTFDKYKKDVLENVSQSKSTIRCAPGVQGSEVWVASRYVPRGWGQEISSGNNFYMWPDKSPIGLTTTPKCPGYYDKAYLQLREPSVTFAFRRIGGAGDIQDGDKVWICQLTDGYFVRGESGLVILKPWAEAVKDELFVFKVVDLKIQN